MDDQKRFDQSTPNLERAREKDRASVGWVVSVNASECALEFAEVCEEKESERQRE